MTNGPLVPVFDLNNRRSLSTREVLLLAGSAQWPAPPYTHRYAPLHDAQRPLLVKRFYLPYRSSASRTSLGIAWWPANSKMLYLLHAGHRSPKPSVCLGNVLRHFTQTCALQRTHSRATLSRFASFSIMSFRRVLPQIMQTLGRGFWALIVVVAASCLLPNNFLKKSK